MWAGSPFSSAQMTWMRTPHGSGDPPWNVDKRRTNVAKRANKRFGDKFHAQKKQSNVSPEARHSPERSMTFREDGFPRANQPAIRERHDGRPPGIDGIAPFPGDTSSRPSSHRANKST
jgi:hypothetical protein